MRKLLSTLGCLFVFVLSAIGQGGVTSGAALRSDGSPATTAIIRICTEAATGTPCSPLANIFTSKTLTVAKDNPFSVDASGNYDWYARPGFYKEQICVGATCFTRTVLVPIDADNAQIGNLNGIRIADDFCTTPGVLDQSCIQGAINAAPDGGEVYIPPGTYAITSAITITKRLTVHGAGWATLLEVGAGVGASTDILTVSPTAALVGLRLADFYIKPASGTPGRYGIRLDGALAEMRALVIERVRIDQLGSSAIRADGSGGAQGTPVASTIRDCELAGGISLANAGDTVRIENNIIRGSGLGVEASFQAGATTFIVRGNNITSLGGSIRLAGNVVAARILENEFETPVGFTGSNGAVVDLDGGTPAVVGTVVENNSFQVVNSIVADALRIDQADNTHVFDNRFQRGAGASKDVVITASANTTWIGANYWEGTFTPEVMIADSGTGTMISPVWSNSGVHGLIFGNNRPLRFLNPAATSLRTLLNYNASEQMVLNGYQERPVILGDNDSVSIYDGTTPGTVRGLFNASGFTVTGTLVASPWASSSGDVADAGVARFLNGDQLCWEASPAGTDVCALDVDASEVTRIGFTGGAGVKIGDNTNTAAVRGILTGTASLDFTALAANSCEVLTITVTGAADGDTVHIGVPDALADVDGATERTTFFAWVNTANTVSVRRCNVTAAATAEPAAATVRATVFKF